jgi:hypothetical protein
LQVLVFVRFQGGGDDGVVKVSMISPYLVNILPGIGERPMRVHDAKYVGFL